MLELYALEISQNILTSIVIRIVAALEWFGGRLDDIDVATPQTLSQEVTRGGCIVQQQQPETAC